MNEEELQRIERGDPESPVGCLLSVVLILGVMALVAFIIWSAW